ncbi:plant UBX domain-containing protein 1-like [Phoenix dactylifera]|uniref:Plant UBX domain-containing protein 1-like n=1 Tax=Phoenix dactylifera TaxID=42345 RepID=A0A8B9AJT2_PHODC|nr:plant UBX domain-containing protein 1-like [Phoenix dactylifera]
MEFKRMKLSDSAAAAAGEAQTKLAAIAVELGREIHVFKSSANALASHVVSATSTEEELEDNFYDLTPEDYYQLMSDKARVQSQILKTQKTQEAEAAARRAQITTAIIRVRFPDGCILEANFQPSEKIQSLVDVLIKVVSQPELPFYLYTTPPKERIRDMSKDFYSAGFAPGAIVHFSYDLPKESTSAVTNGGPYLRDDILSLQKTVPILEHVDLNYSKPEHVVVVNSPAVFKPKRVMNKSTKPRWLKL